MKETPKIKRYNKNLNEGLSAEEVNKRIEDGLFNKAKVKVSLTYLKIIFKNIFTFFNILLIILGAILLAFQLYSSTFFLVILIANTTIGLIQDIRAKIAVDKLNLIEKDTIKVVRDGKIKTINSDDVVLDDIIFLDKNSKVPCDSVVIKGEGSVNESLLTGESLEQRKIINSELFSGTYVTRGEMYARVEKVGEDNYITKLQLKSKEYKKPYSKMYIQLNKLFKVISALVIILGVFELIEFGVFAWLQNHNFEIDSLYDFLKNEIILKLSGSLVAMIPSGMFLLTSTALVVGVISLSSKKVLVKDMYSQETLARVDTLCIDKTGTITDSTLSVFSFELLDKTISKDRFTAIISSYCKKLGDDNDTSKALLKYFKSKEIFDVTSYIPFSSSYKYSAVEMKDIGTLVIGAFNFFNITNKEEIEETVNKYSLSGFRVLVVGISDGKIKNDLLPKNIRCIGLIYLQDHIRENIKETINWFKNNNVDIKVISGDNPLTVHKIAEKAGVENSSNYISLEGMKDEEVKEAALKYSIFGRVSPEQKELIVDSLKQNKRTVAMVGDGVNDILSLKSSDVSIALESGTKPTKDIASIVLLNDDFTKLPSVVCQGRRVINNLQRTCSLFLTKTNFAMFTTILFLLNFLFTGGRDLWPFTPNNFYIWELATIGISSFLLALEPKEQQVKGSFIRNIFKTSLPNGVLISIMVFTVYIMNNFGLLHFESYQLLNIATVFISVASFIPLFIVSVPFNLYRGIVFIIALGIAGTIYAWSMFGFNWLFINGGNSVPPRFLTLDEGITIIEMIGVFLVIEVILILIIKYRKDINKFIRKLFKKEEQDV